MLFISFDQATVTTGYSVFLNKDLIDYGKFKHEGDPFYRLIAQKSNINSIIKDFMDKYPKEKITITFEDIQLQQNVDTFKKLAQLQGAVISGVIEEFGIKPQLVLASSWKGFARVTGRARAEQKRNAQKMIQEKYDKKVTQDEADAILIGFWAANSSMNWGRK